MAGAPFHRHKVVRISGCHPHSGVPAFAPTLVDLGKTVTGDLGTPYNFPCPGSDSRARLTFAPGPTAVSESGRIALQCHWHSVGRHGWFRVR